MSRRGKRRANASTTPKPAAVSVIPPPQVGRVLPMIAILVLATLFCFGRTAGFEFTLWDNYWHPGTDPNFSPPNWANLAQLWTRPHVGLYVPVTYSFWWILAKIGYLAAPDETGSQINPLVFHCANILAHLASVMVVFALARRLIGRNWPACAAALLFALHPVQVESVAWVAGMRDVLAGLLGLVALWQYVCFAAPRDAPGRAVGRHYLLATLAFVAGMFAKPSITLLPLMTAALDYWVLKRSWRQIARSLAPWAALGLVVFIVARVAQNMQGIEVPPLWTRPFIAGYSLVFYLWKLIWPVHLAPDYGARPIELARQGWTYVAWVIPAALGVVAWFMRRRWPWMVGMGLFWVIALLPVLGLTPFEFQYYSTVTDHYLYLAMLGPALMLGWIVSLAHGPARKTFVAGLIVLWLAALGIRTLLQTGYWKDEETLWSHALDVNPHSFTAHYHLGIDFYRHGQIAQARAQYDAALRQRPDFAQVMASVIILDLATRQWDDAVAWGPRLIEANRAFPAEEQRTFLPIYQSIAVVAFKNARPSEAAELFAEIHRLEPGNVAAYEGLQAAQKLAAHQH